MAGFGSNAAVVFEEADITDVMAAVFDAPMLADRRGGCAGGQPDLTGEEGYLVGGVPAAGGGVLAPGEPGDAGGGDNQAVPVGAETAGDVERFDQTMLLASVAVAVDARGAVDGLLGGTDRFDRVVQGLLIGFDLGDQKVSGLPGGFKCFPDYAPSSANS